VLKTWLNITTNHFITILKWTNSFLFILKNNFYFSKNNPYIILSDLVVLILELNIKIT